MNLLDLKTPFEESEIEWRISQCGKNTKGIWAMVVPYISARAIQDRLDFVCGPENWKVEYETLETKAPGIICKLSIKIDNTWVTKEDGSDQTDTEAFKGGLSSALKRAGSIWGIGRYLYGLEAGFATICDKSPGASFSRSKQKDGSYLEFYWKPPSLPGWALPYKKPKEPQSEAPVSQGKTAGLEDKKPQAPKPPAKKPHVSQPQIKRLFTIARASKWTQEQLREFLLVKVGVTSTKEIELRDYENLCHIIERTTFIQALKEASR